jgi:ubiquinone/menaquinone biosynthesis C-methylase UbiE
MLTSKAQLYDLRTANIRSDRFAIEKLIKPGTSVLEVGSGTGRILKWLTGRKHGRIVGVERRADFLKVAASKFSESQNIELVKSDFLKYRSKDPFENILFAFNVFAEFITIKQRVNALKHAKSLLAPHGQIILINSIPDFNDWSLAQKEHRFRIGSGADSWEVLVQCHRDMSIQLSSCEVIYTNVQSRKIIRDNYLSALITRNELLVTYQVAGLNLASEFGTYRLGILKKNSSVMIHVLKS